jgi:hypothetical protein
MQAAKNCVSEEDNLRMENKINMFDKRFQGNTTKWKVEDNFQNGS